jgi:hypothetical protein
MLVSGGKILSIDHVETDWTVSGDGVNSPVGLSEEIKEQIGTLNPPTSGVQLFASEQGWKRWFELKGADWGTYLTDENGETVLDEDGNPQYAEENVNLWTKLRSKEFGSRRSIADRFGRIIDQTYTTSGNVETLIEIHAHDNDMTHDDLNDLLDILGQ